VAAGARAGTYAGWRIVMLTKTACPSARALTDRQLELDGGASCDRWRERALRWIRGHKPEVVVISNLGRYQLMSRSGRPLGTSERETQWRTGLTWTLEQLPARTAALVLADTPNLLSDPVRCLRRNPNDMSACVKRRAATRLPAHDRAERAAARATGARFESLNKLACSYDPCPLVQGNVMMWRDMGHLTATFNRRLSPSFRALVEDVLAATSGAVSKTAGLPTGPPAWSLLASPGEPSSDPAAAPDADGDGLGDGFETRFGQTDPTWPDSDGDGLPDGAEDLDGDGLAGRSEERLGTAPTLPDSDGDGIPDGEDDADGDGAADLLRQERWPALGRLRPPLETAIADRPASYDDGCHSEVLEAAIHPCASGDRVADLRVALFGDSHALQWFPAVSGAAARDGWRVTTLTKSACPSVDTRIRVATAGYDRERAHESCQAWRERALRWLSQHPQDVVIISNAGRKYDVRDPQGRRVDAQERAALWQAGLERTIAAIPESTAVMVVADTPQLQVDPVECLSTGPRRIVRCLTRRAVAILPGHDEVEQAAATTQGASFVDLNGLVCPSDPCPLVIDDTLIWRDTGHVTATYARTLAPSMRRAILSAAAGEPDSTPSPQASFVPSLPTAGASPVGAEGETGLAGSRP
jgi:hypothetical protein